MSKSAPEIAPVSDWRGARCGGPARRGHRGRLWGAGLLQRLWHHPAALLFLNIALAVSLNISNGLAGLFSLGHPAFMTLGAYVAAVLTYPPGRKDFMLPDLPTVLLENQLPLLPAILLAGLAAGVVAFLVGLPVLRLQGHYLAGRHPRFDRDRAGLATNWTGLTRGGSGLNGIPRLTSVWWAFGMAAATFYIAWRLKFSSLGRAMMATRENALAAECRGEHLSCPHERLCAGRLSCGGRGRASRAPDHRGDAEDLWVRARL
jgi:ABC-type branched-subunit amino acid transport system permease subunit